MFVSQWLSLRQLRTHKQVQSHTASLKWHRHSCLCSDEHQLPTSTANIGLPEANEAKTANHLQNCCVECRSR
jgi:hypothetical protein